MNKEIFNKELYTVPPRGPSSSEKYNEMVDVVFDSICLMQDEINGAEIAYHKENIIRAQQDQSLESNTNNILNMLEGIKQTIFSKDYNGVHKGFINIGSSVWTYGPLGSVLDAIEPASRAYIDRRSGYLVPKIDKYVSKLSMFDPIMGSNITVDGICTVSYSDNDNLAFAEDVRYLYDGINTNKWIAVTKYPTSKDKISDTIRIHLDVPPQLVSSFLANNVTLDISPIGFYDVDVVVNKIDSTTTRYTHRKALNKIGIYFQESQVVSVDIFITSTTRNSDIYPGYDSFLFVVNNIDIAHVETRKSAAIFEFELRSGNFLQTITDVYSVDSEFQKINNDSVIYSLFYYSNSDNKYHATGTNSLIPFGATKVYIYVRYIDDNMIDFINNIILEYKVW